MILGCFVLGVLLARLGWIPDYFLEHDGTLYVLYALMFLVGISIGHDRRLGEAGHEEICEIFDGEKMVEKTVSGLAREALG